MPTRDLTQSLDTDATVYPGDPEVESSPAATHESDGYRVTELRLGTHSGTHIDAPSHTEPDGKNLDAFDIESFAFDARVVDCSESGAREPIGVDAVPDYESKESRANGERNENSEIEMLVFRTGWDAHWGTDRYLDHPYLTADAAAACADRGWHVGLDALSPDPSPSETGVESASESNEGEPAGVPAHRELLGSDRFVVENLTGLGDLPERFELRAYPLALAAADGSPVRAVATW
ncbi:cyclase family protein [Halorussus pelagicus]|uniref:cyclase family protein n=1 Tax=Halorussus pelagicus TaxID=2505977 RepID=UPI000FFC1BD6|nr:cyclase family protein [Halorussus pelagicus]